MSKKARFSDSLGATVDRTGPMGPKQFTPLVAKIKSEEEKTRAETALTKKDYQEVRRVLVRNGLL